MKLDIPVYKVRSRGYFEPVSAIILSMIFLSEMPGINSIIGGVLIIFSGYLTLKNSPEAGTR
mgnify:FL=1